MGKCENKGLRLRGTGISAGKAVGTAFVYRDILQRSFEYYDITEKQVPEEWMRIHEAIEKVSADLEHAADKIESRVEDGASDIFLAQQAILNDPTLKDELKEALEKDLVNAEHVVKAVLLRWERKLQQSEREKGVELGSDVADIARRLLLVLEGIHAHSLEKMPEGSVLAAKRLLPSDTVFLSRKSASAIIVEYGGRVSHAAILTRALGIPGVSQLDGLLDRIHPGDTIAVDGDNGEIVINPDQTTLKNIADAEREAEKEHKLAVDSCKQHAVTQSGKSVEVLANVGCLADTGLAAKNGADGIGLYRTEHMYLTRQSPPSEDHIVDALQEALTPVKDRKVVLRLLDAGGDKSVPFFNIAPEHNPFLGMRGIRLLLRNKDMLKRQLRAFLRLSDDHHICALVPMVTMAEDMRLTRKIMHEAAEELGSTKSLPLGAMIETPAAALSVPALARHSDFFSIGTNDLTQYTMVAGRENAEVSDYFKDNHESVMRLLELILEEAGSKPVCLCGELAGRPEELERLISMGVKSISCAPPLIPHVKHHIRKLP